MMLTVTLHCFSCHNQWCQADNGLASFRKDAARRAGKNKCVNITSLEAKYFFLVSPKDYFIDHNSLNKYFNTYIKINKINISLYG